MRRKRITIRSLLLFPFSLLYALIIRIRNGLFDLHILPSTEFELPIISIGNITIGGTGKTPHTEYLLRLLSKEFQVAILSRGYKRKTKGWVLAGPDSEASLIGDEPRQLKQKFPDAIIAVDEKRVNGIKEALKQSPEPDLILLDDAFQHRYVKAGLSILLTDFNRIMTKDFILPAGNLREPLSATKRADLLIVTKCPKTLSKHEMDAIRSEFRLHPQQELFFSSYTYDAFQAVFPSKNKKRLSIDDVTSVLLFTGIAHPLPLKKYLEDQNLVVKNIRFADHHSYNSSDIGRIWDAYQQIDSNKSIILTTEKDAMRLVGIHFDDRMKEKLYYLPVRVNIENDQEAGFNDLILNYVKKNRRKH